MAMDSQTDTISCPFCLNCEFKLQPGKVSCRVCLTDFEITAEGECIFFDAHKSPLPIRGIFCKKCRLFQYGKKDSCPKCGAVIVRKK